MYSVSKSFQPTVKLSMEVTVSASLQPLCGVSSVISFLFDLPLLDSHITGLLSACLGHLATAMLVNDRVNLEIIWLFRGEVGLLEMYRRGQY